MFYPSFKGSVNYLRSNLWTTEATKRVKSPAVQVATSFPPVEVFYMSITFVIVIHEVTEQ